MRLISVFNINSISLFDSISYIDLKYLNLFVFKFVVKLICVTVWWLWKIPQYSWVYNTRAKTKSDMKFLTSRHPQYKINYNNIFHNLTIKHYIARKTISRNKTEFYFHYQLWYIVVQHKKLEHHRTKRSITEFTQKNAVNRSNPIVPSLILRK